MTNLNDKQRKILAGIASKGWMTKEIYLNDALELQAAGLIKTGERFATGGNRKLVWVGA